MNKRRTHGHGLLPWLQSFNPIMPIYLRRETWEVIDLAVAIILLISLFFIKGKKPVKQGTGGSPKS
jgi:hypothetical protein